MSMSHIRNYFIADKVISTVPASHDLDGPTRLYIRIEALPEVASVAPPSFDNYGFDSTIDEHGDFVWWYGVDKNRDYTWDEVDAAIAKATNDFLKFATGVTY